MSNTTEKMLDTLFSNAAKEVEKEQQGKRYKYTRYTGSFYDKVASKGECIVKSRTYNKSVDCDVLKCVDVNTYEEFTCNQFALDLVEI